MDIPILYESKWLLAVNKPPGLLVEHSPHYPSVEDWAKTHIAKQERNPYVGIIHRLDRPVSGVLLIAKRKAALKDLNEQFRERTVEKVYLAIAAQAPPKQSDTITHFLRKDQKEKRALIFDKAQKDTVECQLTYRFLTQNKQGYILEIYPHSGKFHQIRTQLAAIGCSIIGDEKYGSTLIYQQDAIALHAWKLTFVEPLIKEKMTVEAPPPLIFSP